MHYAGDLSVLADLCAGEPVTIAAEGSGFRSATTVGFLEALARAHVEAKAYVGVSGSAGPIAAHLSGNSEDTFEVYKKLARDGCFEWKYAFNLPIGVGFDQDALLREIELRLDTGKLKKSTAHFGVSVLNYEDGTGRILDGKTDVLQKIAATTAIPGLCNPVSIDGVPYVDGISLRMEQGVRKYWARKIIVFRSRCKWWWEDMLYAHIVRCNFAALPRPLVESVAVADAEFERELLKLRTCGRVRCLEIGPDESDPFIWPWCHDVDLLSQLRNRAREYLTRLIDTHGAYAPQSAT